MRIAIFTDHDFDRINGLTTTLTAVLRHAPADFKPRIYTFSDLETDERNYLALKCPRLPVPGSSGLRLYLPRLRHIQERMKADAVRVVHVTTPGPSGLAGRYLARRNRLPLIGSLHTPLTHPSLESWRASRAIGGYRRWFYEGCERVLVPSRDTSGRLVDDGWESARLAVWPRGVDATLFSPERRSESLRERWSVSDKRPAILYAGRLTHEKGVAMLEHIGSQLYRRRRAHRFIIAGEGSLSGELRHAIPDAVFMGQLPQDQLATAIASADVCVFPSDADSGCSVVLEAQACGVPVVVSAAGGASENMIDGETGFVCRPSDHVAFATGIEKLLADRAHRRAIGVAARRFAAGRPWQLATSVLFASYRAAIAAATDSSGARPPARPRLVSARLRR